MPLFVWLSPSFPTGGFAYSHGLEWAVETGAIGDAASLAAWLSDLVAYGGVRSDAVLLALSYSAPTTESLTTNDLALALCATRERRLETATQGNAFLSAVRGAWPCAALDRFVVAVADEDVAYPVAVGIAAAAHAIALAPTLRAFALASIGNLVSAAVRLGPIGQSEAQRIIADLCPAVATLAAEAERATADDLGTCAWRGDIAAMRHESQYSRLFRS